MLVTVDLRLFNSYQNHGRTSQRNLILRCKNMTQDNFLDMKDRVCSSSYRHIIRFTRIYLVSHYFIELIDTLIPSRSTYLHRTYITDVPTY